MLALEQTTYLGPAEVVRVEPGRVQIDLPDDQPWAQLALAFPYQPAVGDLLLVVGQEEAWYVIGVLRGAGKTSLTVPGDLEIRAPQGRIEMSAGKGVTIRGPLVRVVANKLELAARSVFERFTEATRWIQGAFQLRAGRVRTRVEESYRLQAGRIVQNAQDDVKIDGEKIHLG